MKDLRNILLIAELGLCAPFSNAAIERFFSQMRIVKTDGQNKLNEKNLSSLLYIKTPGPTLTEYYDHYCSPTVNLRINDKDRRLNQRKRKKYKRKDAKTYQKFTLIYPQFLMLTLKRAVENVKLRTSNDSIHLLLEFCLKDLTVEIWFKRL